MRVTVIMCKFMILFESLLLMYFQDPYNNYNIMICTNKYRRTWYCIFVSSNNKCYITFRNLCSLSESLYEPLICDSEEASVQIFSLLTSLTKTITYVVHVYGVSHTQPRLVY